MAFYDIICSFIIILRKSRLPNLIPAHWPLALEKKEIVEQPKDFTKIQPLIFKYNCILVRIFYIRYVSHQNSSFKESTFILQLLIFGQKLDFDAFRRGDSENKDDDQKTIFIQTGSFCAKARHRSGEFGNETGYLCHEMWL